MTIFTLKTISVVQMGLMLARKKADNGSFYSYRRLTSRALECGSINPEAMEPFFSTEPLQSEYLTRTGSIVMKLSFPFSPVVITEETEGYVFPSQMVRITPAKSILPEYLCFYLSRDFVAERLLANYFWIAQKAITVDSLLNLEVRVPSLKNQRIICDYYRNYLHIRRLREELDKEEQVMVNYIFSVFSKDGE